LTALELLPPVASTYAVIGDEKEHTYFVRDNGAGFV
jgi:hypothetical protein